MVTRITIQTIKWKIMHDVLTTQYLIILINLQDKTRLNLLKCVSWCSINKRNVATAMFNS